MWQRLSLVSLVSLVSLLSHRRWLRQGAALWRRYGGASLEILMMVGVLALAAYLDFWRLSANSYGNLYYAAAVRSMAQSWHNLFYVSYDPGGYISVDKPPLGFWLMVASVKIFGYHPFSLLAPEALAGVCSVAVLWRVVRWSFGPVAGVIAALALAVSPVNVVVNRDNVLEPLLTLLLLLATWATLAATKRASGRWLVVAAVLIGLAFNVKALEAYLVVPALAALYFVGASASRRTRLAHLAVAGVLMLALSFTWVTAVDLTPASQRPYVGSSATNSELDLTFGYNGLLRFFGGSLTPRPSHHPALPIDKGTTTSDASHVDVTSRSSACALSVDCRSSQTTKDKGNLGSPSALGAVGPLRLFLWGLGGQIGWLLPLAIFGLLVGWRSPHRSLACLRDRLRKREARRPTSATMDAPTDAPNSAQLSPLSAAGPDGARLMARQQGYVLWGVWLITQGVFFSAAHFINSYYTAVLAPAICALAGVGIVGLWQAYTQTQRRGGWRGWLLPLALLATGGEQAYLIAAAQDWQRWLHPVWIVAPIALAIGLSGMLVVSRWGEMRTRDRRAGSALAGVALLALLLAPTLWSFSSLTWGNAGGWPVAGPLYARDEPAWDPLVDPYLVRYLEAHRDHARYLVATADTYMASPLIIATGQPVMALGGFSGDDPAMTPGKLIQLIARGEVKFFLLPSSNVTATQYALLFPPPAHAGVHLTHGSSAQTLAVTTPATPAHVTRFTNPLTRLVSGLCSPVRPRLWSSATYANHRLGAFQLYACERASVIDHDAKPDGASVIG